MHTQQVSADSYFNNSLASCEAKKKRKLARLFEPRNRRRWSMSIMSVNSYYDNAVNGLFITAGAWRVATHVHVCVCLCVRAKRHVVTYTHICTCICVCKWRVASGDMCAGLLCIYRMHVHHQHLSRELWHVYVHRSVRVYMCVRISVCINSSL